jgi:hypothetical protein
MGNRLHKREQEGGHHGKACNCKKLGARYCGPTAAPWSGTVLIPSFAVGRAQEILYHRCGELAEEGEIPHPSGRL